MTMTLEQVRDEIAIAANFLGPDGRGRIEYGTLVEMQACLNSHIASQPAYPAVFTGDLNGRHVGLHGTIESVEALEAYIASQPKASTDAQVVCDGVVAWQYRVTRDGGGYVDWQPWDHEDRPEMIGRWKAEYRPLYTHPAPSQAVDTAGDGVTDAALAIEWANIHEAESRRYLVNQSFTNARRHSEISKFLRRAALASPSAPRVGVPEGVKHQLLEAYDYGQFCDYFDQPLAPPIRKAVRALCEWLAAAPESGGV